MFEFLTGKNLLKFVTQLLLGETYLFELILVSYVKTICRNHGQFIGDVTLIRFFSKQKFLTENLN